MKTLKWRNMDHNGAGMMSIVETPNGWLVRHSLQSIQGNTLMESMAEVTDPEHKWLKEGEAEATNA